MNMQLQMYTQLHRLSGFLVLFFICQSSWAQNDSTTVQKAKWETKKVARGVKLRHFWFDHSLFGSNQNVNILEVKLTGKNRVEIEAEEKALLPTSDFGTKHKALAAVNGTFFDMKNGGSVDFVRLNGKTFQENKLTKKGQRTFHQRAAIITNHNQLRIEPWNGNPEWEQQLPGDDVMVTGPLLVYEGQPLQMDTTSFSKTRHPRTAVAVKGKKLLLVTVDGRNEKAAGMSLAELSKLLRWIGASEAVNLDGGGSTTMWVKGFPDGGVVNHPSDNKKMMKSAAYKPGMDLDNLAADATKWDHGGERPVANVLLISRRN